MYWPASDVFTGSTVWVSIKPTAVARLPPGLISSTVGCTARCGISVTVHCRVCESPAVTVESSTLATSGAGRSVGREIYAVISREILKVPYLLLCTVMSSTALCSGACTVTCVCCVVTVSSHV